MEDIDIKILMKEAIDRIIKEWCYDCNHSNMEQRHCNFKNYKEHCAIANLIYFLENNYGL